MREKNMSVLLLIYMISSSAGRGLLKSIWEHGVIANSVGKLTVSVDNYVILIPLDLNSFQKAFHGLEENIKVLDYAESLAYQSLFIPFTKTVALKDRYGLLHHRKLKKPFVQLGRAEYPLREETRKYSLKKDNSGTIGAFINTTAHPLVVRFINREQQKVSQALSLSKERFTGMTSLFKHGNRSSQAWTLNSRPLKSGRFKMKSRKKLIQGNLHTFHVLEGLVNSQQAERIEEQLGNLNDSLLDIMHLDDQLLTLMKLTTLGVTDLTQHKDVLDHAVGALSDGIQSIREVQKKEQLYSAELMLMFSAAQFTRQIQTALDHLNRAIANLYEAVSAVCQGILSPMLINPAELRLLLGQILAHIPRKLAPPITIDVSEIFKLYPLIKTNFGRLGKHINIALSIPLVDASNYLELVSFNAFPIPLDNTSRLTVRHAINNKDYFAVTPDRTQVALIDPAQLNSCPMVDENYFCDSFLWMRKSGRPVDCVKSLLTGISVNKHCDRIIQNQPLREEFVAVGNDQWAYSLTAPTRFNVICSKIHPSGRSKEEGSLVWLGRLGIFALAPDCHMESGSHYLPASHKGVRWANSTWRPDFKHLYSTHDYLRAAAWDVATGQELISIRHANWVITELREYLLVVSIAQDRHRLTVILNMALSSSRSDLGLAEPGSLLVAISLWDVLLAVGVLTGTILAAFVFYRVILQRRAMNLIALTISKQKMVFHGMERQLQDMEKGSRCRV